MLRVPLVILGISAEILFAPALFVGLALLLSHQPGDRFVSTLEALDVPPTWEAIHTEVVDGGFMTHARATRYFLVDAALPDDVVPTAKSIATAAG